MNEYYNELIKGLTIERDALKARVARLDSELRIEMETGAHIWQLRAEAAERENDRLESSFIASRRQVEGLKEALRLFRAWVDAEKERIAAVERYNTVLKDQHERGIFPVKVADEWAAIGAAEKRQRDALKEAFESAQHDFSALDAPQPDARDEPTRTCRFCGKIAPIVCMNTRDMDPIDGPNNNPRCNKALSDCGGGERGYVWKEPDPRDAIIAEAVEIMR